jgi:hypothetical protein
MNKAERDILAGVCIYRNQLYKKLQGYALEVNEEQREAFWKDLAKAFDKMNVCINQLQRMNDKQILGDNKKHK